MKRLLMVAHFFPPVGGGGVVRTLGFVRHLPGLGWQPVVLTGTGSSAWVRDDTLMEGLPELEILRAHGGRPGGGVGAGGGRTRMQALMAGLAPWVALPDAYSGWTKAATDAGEARVREGGISALYSTSPPDTDHLVALELKRRTGLPWVADFRDPWIGLGFRDPPTPWHRAWHRARLREVLRAADQVICATEGTGRFLVREEPSCADRLGVIPNGFEAEVWRTVRPRCFDHFTVLHAGRLTGDRDVRALLAGVSRFLERDPGRRNRFQVLLPGPHERREEDRVRAEGLADVIRFPGSIPHREVLEMEAGADLLLLIKHLDPRYRDLIPGKLYEYLGAGRPILALCGEGPAAELVRGLRAGQVVSPGSPDAMAAALELAWARPAGLPMLPAPERERFTRAALSAELVRVLEGMV